MLPRLAGKASSHGGGHDRRLRCYGGGVGENMSFTISIDFLYAVGALFMVWLVFYIAYWMFK